MSLLYAMRPLIRTLLMQEIKKKKKKVKCLHTTDSVCSVTNALKSYDREAAPDITCACLRVSNREVRFLVESLFRKAFNDLNKPVYQVRLNRLKYPIGLPAFSLFFFFFLLKTASNFQVAAA